MRNAPAVLRLLLALGLAGALPFCAHALPIDSFTSPFPAHPDLPVGGYEMIFVGNMCDGGACPPGLIVSHPVSDMASQTGLAGVLGGARVATITRVSAGGNASADIWGPGNMLCLSHGPLAGSRLLLEYGKTVDLDANFTSGGADAVLVTVTDGDMYAGPRPVPCTITLTSRRGTPQQVTASSTQNLVLAGAYPFLFTSFPGVDFTDIDAVTVLFNAGAVTSVDFCIAPLETREPPTPAVAKSWGGVKAIYR